MKKYAVGLAIVIIACIAFVLFRGRENAASTTLTTGQEVSEVTSGITIGGVSLEATNAAKAEAVSAPVGYTPKLRDQRLSDIRISQVQKIDKFGSQNILVFKDGSELSVTRSMMADLPDNIRYQLEYSRDQ